jgi:hypothetical protein
MKAQEEAVDLKRVTLKHMRPAAVTGRVDEGDENITNATGHSSLAWSDRSTIVGKRNPPGDRVGRK